MGSIDDIGREFGSKYTVTFYQALNRISLIFYKIKYLRLPFKIFIAVEIEHTIDLEIGFVFNTKETLIFCCANCSPEWSANATLQFLFGEW